MGDSGDRVEPDKVVGFEGEANEVSYTKRDLLLYALGIGCVPSVQCIWCMQCDRLMAVCARRAASASAQRKRAAGQQPSPSI